MQKTLEYVRMASQRHDALDRELQYLRRENGRLRDELDALRGTSLSGADSGVTSGVGSGVASGSGSGSRSLSGVVSGVESASASSPSANASGSGAVKEETVGDLADMLKMDAEYDGFMSLEGQGRGETDDEDLFDGTEMNDASDANDMTDGTKRGTRGKGKGKEGRGIIFVIFVV